MFLINLPPYRKLETPKYELYKQRQKINGKFLMWLFGVSFLCVFILSLMVVKVSSTTTTTTTTPTPIAAQVISSRNRTERVTLRLIPQNHRSNYTITTTTATPAAKLKEYYQKRRKEAKTNSNTTTTTGEGTASSAAATTSSRRKAQSTKRVGFKKVKMSEKVRARQQKQKQQQRLQEQQRRLEEQQKLEMQKREEEEAERELELVDQEHERDREMENAAIKRQQMERIQQEQRDRVQQQQYQNQQQQQQHHQQQQTNFEQLQTLHANNSANIQLLERYAAKAHEQPIYGTWSTKARRPKPPGALATATAPSQFIALTSHTNSSISAVALALTPTPSTVAMFVGDEKRLNTLSNYQQHIYEQLPRRSSTMTPVKINELSDQIPRPPRLTSRRPSVVLRRQYVDLVRNATSLSEEEKPKPFHFPHEGPLPQEFKKPDAERTHVNNIQDILEQLKLNNPASQAANPVLLGGMGGVAKMPQMVMMPSGLHIAGTFKNFKSSGIGNFFRNKRSKKQQHPMQLMLPLHMPMQLLNAHHAPVYAAMAPPITLAQRISMDQFFPFKPRSPHDINLLAMQQELRANRDKEKKKQKVIANNNLVLQQSDQRPYSANPFVQMQPQLFANNLTQKQLLKRIPFKLNLDIYPVLTPTKDYKAVTAPTGSQSSSFTLDEAKQPPHLTPRPITLVRNPYLEYYGSVASPSPAVYGFNGYNGQGNNYESIYSALKIPLSSVQPQTIQNVGQASNMQIIYPERAPKYIQQQQQQQQYQQQQQQYQQQQQQYHQQQYAQQQQPQKHPQTFQQALLKQPQSQQSQQQQQQQHQLQIQQQQLLYKQPQYFQQRPASQSLQNIQSNQALQSIQPQQQIPSQQFFTPTPITQIAPTPYEPYDCDDPTAEAATSPIMVHLNVFPKESAPSTRLTSAAANPFYNHNDNNNNNPFSLQRNIIPEETEPLLPLEPREARKNTFANNTVPQEATERSDDLDFQPMVSYEQKQQLQLTTVSNKLDASETATHYNDVETPDRNQSSNQSYQQPSMDQLVSAARAASLFRFPVEDLIQFQVDDAL